MRTARHALTICARLSVAACGGEDVPTGAEAERGARDAVTGYFDAVATRDVERACGVFTAGHRKRFEERTGMTCEEAVERTGRETPPELRKSVAAVRVEDVRTDGRGGSVTVRASDRYAAEARRTTVEVRYVDGRWRIDDLPFRQDPDPVTTCIVGGLRTFGTDQSDPFWFSEGRGDFAAFITAFCKRGFAREILREDGRKPAGDAAERLAAEIIREMVRDGRIEDPRG